MIHTATVPIYFDIKQFEVVLFDMAFILGNINNRAVLIQGDHYFDTEGASKGTVSSNPMHAIAQLPELHALSAQLHALTPTGKLAEVTLGPPIPQPKNCFAVGLNYKSHAAEAISVGVSTPFFPLRRKVASTSNSPRLMPRSAISSAAKPIVAVAMMSNFRPMPIAAKFRSGRSLDQVSKVSLMSCW